MQILKYLINQSPTHVVFINTIQSTHTIGDNEKINTFCIGYRGKMWDAEYHNFENL